MFIAGIERDQDFAIDVGGQTDAVLVVCGEVQWASGKGQGSGIREGLRWTHGASQRGKLACRTAGMRRGNCS